MRPPVLPLRAALFERKCLCAATLTSEALGSTALRVAYLHKVFGILPHERSAPLTYLLIF